MNRITILLTLLLIPAAPALAQFKERRPRRRENRPGADAPLEGRRYHPSLVRAVPLCHRIRSRPDGMAGADGQGGRARCITGSKNKLSDVERFGQVDDDQHPLDCRR